jgi:hypothetical protein
MDVKNVTAMIGVFTFTSYTPAKQTPKNERCDPSPAWLFEGKEVIKTYGWTEYSLSYHFFQVTHVHKALKINHPVITMNYILQSNIRFVPIGKHQPS